MNNKTTIPQAKLIPICLSLRDNAACCIPLCVICAICGRITRKRTQAIRTEETTISLADPADTPNTRQRNPQPYDAACCIT